MSYVRSTICIALLVSLWGIAAALIAPAMERRLQADALALLADLDGEFSAEADGLNVFVSGTVDNMEERYEVFARLKPMHPLARIRPEISIVESPRFERKLNRGVINLNTPAAAANSNVEPAALEAGLTEVPVDVEHDIEERNTVIDVGLGSCSDLQLLDPSVACN